MKIIVAPTSLPPASLHAVTYAAELAHLIKAHLHLIHVYPAGFLSADVLLPEEGVTELAEVVNRKMYSHKENLRKKFYSSLIVHLRTLKGDASAEINKYCEKVNAYAVVLTLVTLQGVIFGAGILMLFMDAMNAGYSLERTRTLVFSSLVLGNLLLTFTGRSFTKTIDQTIKYTNPLAKYVLGVSTLFLLLLNFSSGVRKLFGLELMSASDWFTCILISAISILWIELYIRVRVKGGEKETEK